MQASYHAVSGGCCGDGIRKNRPPKVLVQMLCVTEKQYAGMEYIVGVGESDVLTTDERFVEL